MRKKKNCCFSINIHIILKTKDYFSFILIHFLMFPVPANNEKKEKKAKINEAPITHELLEEEKRRIRGAGDSMNFQLNKFSFIEIDFNK